MMKKENILFVADELTVGGIETYLNEFSNHLKKEGHEISLLSWSNSLFKSPPSIKHHEVFPIDYSGFFLIRYSRLFIKQFYHFQKIFYKTHPTIILLNLSKSSFFSIPFLMIIKIFYPKIRILYNFHGSRYYEEKNSYHFYASSKKASVYSSWKIKIRTLIFLQLYWLSEKISFSIVHQIIVFSKYSQKILTGNFKVEKGKIHLILPGLPHIKKYIQSKAKEELGLNTDWPLILTISRLEPRKGMIEFLKVAKKIKLSNPHVNILFASIFHQDINHTAPFFTAATELNLGRNVYYINNPTREDVALLYSACDLFLMPSICFETFGFTTLEILSFGKPVAGFNIGANPEVIKNGQTGFLRRPQDLLELANDINNYLLMSSRTKHIYKTHFSNELKKYSWKNYCEKFFKYVRSGRNH